ncbi:thiol-disulfide oxidoreductase [Planctomycetes bacterium CA13]|uniref:Thiol-disulfide oxidoreductase n=1 Tax=Novipirellula herctigrandis TaxID=2527986 RepID=A0A5C5Z1J3_9BACT|nr:thiol-disulfide oxidoreductase [Planctomycetes bacterium CA13]
MTKRFSVKVLFSLSTTLLLSLAGCGGEVADSPVVPPPESQKASSSANEASRPVDAPGTLELPPGEIPSESNDQEEPTESGGLEMPTGVEVPEANLDTSSVQPASQTIQFAQWSEIEKQVVASKKLTVVDFWSLSCQPCLKEFSGLVRLHNALGDKVRCVAVDVDFDGRKSRPPEYYQERVAAFLTKVGARFPTYISKTSSDEIFAELDIDSIPAVFVFDANGKLVKRFVDSGDTVGFSYDKDVIPLVSQLAG